MAKAKVTFLPKADFDRFQFHTGDGKEVVVDENGYATNDPVLIAYLDEQPAVKRAKSDDGKDS